MTACRHSNKLGAMRDTLFTKMAALAVAMMMVAPAAARAQTFPSTRAAAVVVTPPGFVRFTAGGRTFVTLPADQSWVAAAAARAAARAAAPGPTTQPADMLQRLPPRRDALVAAMLADVTTFTPAQIDQFLDKQLVPLMKDLSQVAPRLVYMVAPSEHVKDALRAGWADPRIHFNKADDTFEVSRSVAFDVPGKTDESIVIVLFKPDDTEDRRVARLSQYLTAAEADVLQSVASRATSLMIAVTATFIADKGMAGLPRGEDQVWLADGLSTVLATKYISMIHGAPQLQFVRQVAMNPPESPVNPVTIDLLHPQPGDQLLPQLVVPYAAARHRKDVAVMYLWLLRAGEKKIAPMIADITRLRPADGATLAKALAASSGVDMSTDLAAQ